MLIHDPLWYPLSTTEIEQNQLNGRAPRPGTSRATAEQGLALEALHVDLHEVDGGRGETALREDLIEALHLAREAAKQAGWMMVDGRKVVTLPYFTQQEWKTMVKCQGTMD